MFACRLLRSRLHTCFVSLRRMSQMKIGFATDIEGNLRYWKRYLQQSEVLDVMSDGSIALRDECFFVYGGDVCDRGPGDIRLMRDLCSLKEKYPERVALLLGNRDINKLRMISELHPAQTHTGRVYWLRDAPDMPVLREDASEDERLVHKVKWMLANTMGAPDAFTHRQHELQELGLPADEISTANSFKGGEMRRYLSLGQLGAIIGDCLCVHGALHQHNIGYMPPSRDHTTGRVIPDIRQWINELNAFKDQELAQLANCSIDYSSRVPWSATGGYEHPEPASRLMQYAMGWAADGSVIPTVIYTNYLDRSGKPTDSLANTLSQQGIRVVLTGHQPHGDAPLIISSNPGDEALHMIVGDTSYANNVIWADTAVSNRIALPSLSEQDDAIAECSDDMRGAAVSEIVITQHQQRRTSIMIKGLLSNGLQYCFDAVEEKDVGKAAGDGHVKAVVHTENSKYYLVTESEGRKIVNKLVADVNTRIDT